MVDYKLLGQKIQNIRKARGITQEDLAEKVDITSVHLSRIENGRGKPSIDLCDAICAVLNCELPNLFSDITTDSPNYQNEKVIELFRACSPKMKPRALNILKELAEISDENKKS